MKEGAINSEWLERNGAKPTLVGSGRDGSPNRPPVIAKSTLSAKAPYLIVPSSVRLSPFFFLSLIIAPNEGLIFP